MDVLASLIVPIYRFHPYIASCLDSLERQDASFRYEILLLDFGGDEEASRLCREREREKPLLYRYYRRERNEGVSRTRNVGILAARGKYLAFVDSDDELEKDFLSLLVSLAEKKEADIAVAGYFLQKGRKKRRGYSRLRKEGKGKAFLCHLLKSPFLRQRTFVWGKVYRRSMLREGGIFLPPLTTYEDLPFTYQALLHARKVVSIRKPLYRYRQWEGSVMARKKDSVLQSHLQAFLAGKDLLAKEDPALARSLFARRRLAVTLQLRFDARQDVRNGKDPAESRLEYRRAVNRIYGRERT